MSDVSRVVLLVEISLHRRVSTVPFIKFTADVNDVKYLKITS